jgi:hypothetical protein
MGSAVRPTPQIAAPHPLAAAAGGKLQDTGSIAQELIIMSVGSIGASNPGLTAPALPHANAAKAAGGVLSTLSTQSTAASLEGQIRAAREQLNDWATCISATTPKGQAEIRSLSAQISAAQEHINRLAGRAGAVDTAAAASGSVDLWA